MAMFGAMPGISAAAPGAASQMASLMPQQPKKKGGLFGSGKGLGEIIPQMIMGYLASRGNPVGMAGLQQMMAARQQAMQEQQHQQRRGEDFEDFVKKQAWQIANNPRTQQPHYFEDNSGNLMAIGPDGKPQMVHKDPLPFKLVPNGLGGVVPVDLRTLMSGHGGGQPAPQGVTFTPIDEGGPAPQGPGGFRSPY